MKGNDLFSLDIKGNQLTAQSKALLSPGQTLQLQMISASPQVELKIVSPPPQEFSGRALKRRVGNAFFAWTTPGVG